MCGIAGYLLREGNATAELVRAMCNEIVHRGPDDEGVHVDAGCGIGMRRLSIIDLSTGHQPIPNEDHSVWIVFNGEIYNYQELRKGLIGKGHRFQTNSDTETIVHLYEEEGVNGIAKLRGMFAFAVWDARKGALLLARDRFGKKPLYYADLPQGVYFGSELKCLRAAGVPLELDREALRLYFRMAYIPDPWSPFRAIRKLPAATWRVHHRDGRVEQGRYWKLPEPAGQAEPGLTEEGVCGQIREIFDESVRLRMIADVPLGAFLSGGIDSTSVVASMARQTQEPVKTFSIGFEEAEFNELAPARMVASRYRTEHREMLVRPDSVDLIPKLVRHFDEPFGDSSAIPTYLVSRFTAEHVKVALTGDGGDELFGGYESFLRAQRMKVMDRVPQAARLALRWISRRLPYAAYGKNFLWMMGSPTGLERYFEQNYTPSFVLKQLMSPDLLMPVDTVFLERVLGDYLPAETADVVTKAMYFEATANLTGDMLVKVDRMSMANSLEVRCPLLDHELAELAARIPHAWKIGTGHGRRGKEIFVRAMGDRLPAELLALPKKGFAVPLATWFRGPLREMLRDHLMSKSFLGRGVAAPGFVERLMQEHLSGRRDNYYLLWRLLMFELWFVQWEQRQPAPVYESKAVM